MALTRESTEAVTDRVWWIENLQTNQRVLINFRAPETLKNTFDLLCKYEAKIRTTTLLTLMRDYVSDKGPKVQQQISEATAIGNLLDSNIKTARKSTTTNFRGDDTKNLETCVHTHGNLVQHPISKTWMTANEYRKLS
ncbi:MAG: hypothetical protein P8M79_11100 [Alphaproteobacteria bacterium]|nr:hypothetical protein [Alphaproteobacteria bacterium]